MRKPKTKAEIAVLRERLVLNRANKETYRGQPVHLKEADYDIEEGKPKYVVRAVYGPVSGLASSSIVVFPHDSDLLQRRSTKQHELVEFINDGMGSWGPRQFLFKLFQEVANHHGDCVIYMVHSGETIEIDREQFEAWVRSTNENPVRALLEVRPLLEEHRGS